MGDTTIRTQMEQGRGQRRRNANPSPLTLAEVYSQCLALPWLRGYWPMSSMDSSANAYDLSGQGRTLTNTGGVGVGLDGHGFVFYADYDGVADVHARATEASLVLTNRLTVGGWFLFDALAANTVAISKDGGAANRGWLIFGELATSAFQFEVSGDGTNMIAVQSDVGSLVTGQWHFVVGRYTFSTELALYVDGKWAINTTSIPASLFASTAPFNIGAKNSTSSFLNGRAALCFLAAWPVPNNTIEMIYQRSRVLFGI